MDGMWSRPSMRTSLAVYVAASSISWTTFRDHHNLTRFRYYNTVPANEAAGHANSAALNKLFDKYRDDPKNAPDAIGMEGTMKYFQDLGVDIEDIGMLVISELVRSPSMGEITREGFVDGWKVQGYVCSYLAPGLRLCGVFRRRIDVVP
jgi:hypothetical protein